MFEFENSLFINRPPQEVFDFLTNPGNDPQWRSSAVSGEWTSQDPIGVGSTFNTIDKFLGRKIESTNEITIWDPPNQFGFKTVGGPMPFEATTTLESKENGTQLTLRGQAELGGLFKIAEGLAGKQIEKQSLADFDALKLLLEEGKA